RQVLRVLVAADQVPGHAPRASLMPAHERFESRFPALLRGADQRMILGVILGALDARDPKSRARIRGQRVLALARGRSVLVFGVAHLHLRAPAEPVEPNKAIEPETRATREHGPRGAGGSVESVARGSAH